MIPDVAERIIGAVNELRAAYDQIFTTGGIGPTHDDITSECVAAAFGVPWEHHAETFAIMQERMGEISTLPASAWRRCRAGLSQLSTPYRWRRDSRSAMCM